VPRNVLDSVARCRSRCQYRHTSAGTAWKRIRGQACAQQRHTARPSWIPLIFASPCLLSFLPTLEIHSCRERRQHDEQRECDVSALRELRSRIERIRSTSHSVSATKTIRYFFCKPELVIQAYPPVTHPRVWLLSEAYERLRISDCSRTEKKKQANVAWDTPFQRNSRVLHSASYRMWACGDNCLHSVRPDRMSHRAASSFMVTI